VQWAGVNLLLECKQMDFRRVAVDEVKATTSSSINQLDYLQDRAHLNSALIVSKEIDLNSFWRAYLGENQILLKRVLNQLGSVGVNRALTKK